MPGPLRDRTPGEVDMVVYRENTEGEYAASAAGSAPARRTRSSIQTAVFTRRGSERIVRFAFELRARAATGSSLITKSNALIHSMVLWDEVVAAVAPEYPDVRRCAAAVDAGGDDGAAAGAFDAIVASNLFGDILTDLVRP